MQIFALRALFHLDAGWLVVSYFVICICISVDSRLETRPQHKTNEYTTTTTKHTNETERTSDDSHVRFTNSGNSIDRAGFVFYLNDSVFHFHLIFIVHTHTASREISATITEPCSRANVRTTSFTPHSLK